MAWGVNHSDSNSALLSRSALQRLDLALTACLLVKGGLWAPSPTVTATPGTSARRRKPSVKTRTGMVFASFVDGYDALLDDLRAKFTGHTESGLGPGSSLLGFFRAYAPSSDHNYPDQYAVFVAHWLTVALRFPVGLNTTLAEIWKP